jgi:DNA-binding XRE family transcriptional regulator
MKHDLLHIQGKPYMLVPLHEYRMMSNESAQEDANLPDDILDEIHAQQSSAIKIVRKYRDLTQAELAGQAGLSRPYLTEIETGKKQGSVKAIRAIAETLGVPTGLLVS